MRKYPATIDAASILRADNLNARSDGGDTLSVVDLRPVVKSSGGGSTLGEGLFTPMPRIPVCDLSIVQQAVEPLTDYYCPAPTEIKDAILSKAIPTVDPLVWTIAA
jgi:hypothetical protein